MRKDSGNNKKRWINKPEDLVDGIDDEFIQFVDELARLFDEDVEKAGDLLDKDPEDGIKKLKSMAENNYPKALFALANCYMKGIGVKKDNRLAVQYLERAAQKRSVEASAELALFYAHEIEDSPVPFDEKRAVELFEAAAYGEDGKQFYNGLGYFYLGMYTMNGKLGLKKDRAEAISLLKRSSETGFPPGCEKYGDILMKRGDYAGAVEAYEKADPKSEIILIKLKKADEAEEERRIERAIKEQQEEQENRKKQKRFWE